MSALGADCPGLQLRVERLLLTWYRRRRFHHDAGHNRGARRNAAQNTAVIIATKATGVHFVVHLATPHSRGGKTSSNLYALHRGKRHEGAHNGGVKLAKDRLAQTGWNAGSDHFNNSANRVPFFPGLFDLLAHGRYAVRVNAAQLIPFDLFPHVALRSNTANLNNAANYRYAKFREQLFCQGPGNHAAHRFAG